MKPTKHEKRILFGEIWCSFWCLGGKKKDITTKTLKGKNFMVW